MKKTTIMATVNSNGIKMNCELKNYGKKTMISFFLLLITLTASAQKAKVLDVFFKNGIDSSILNPEKIKRPDNYAFDFKQIITTSASEAVTIAKFDPSSPEPERWTVVSIDGKTASKSATNSFRKNQSKALAATTADDASYKIEKETGDQLVISYKLDPSSLTKETNFMKDCRFYMTVNPKSKRLEQLQILNEKQVKINILSADKFDLIQKFKWNDQAKQYFTLSENVIIEAKFIGQAANVATTSEYTNYTKK